MQPQDRKARCQTARQYFGMSRIASRPPAASCRPSFIADMIAAEPGVSNRMVLSDGVFRPWAVSRKPTTSSARAESGPRPRILKRLLD
jgi:hypothetical protein